MSYVTVEVDIDKGRIIARDPEQLPANGKGLLAILPESVKHTGARPFGLAKGQFTVPADFNSPLPEDVLRSFEAA
jgi:hypothetical protein